MGQPTARQTDKILQNGPHCHAPIHPPAPVPTPIPHPPLPLTIISPNVPTVKVGKMSASVLMDMTTPCSLPSCVPAGPGQTIMGSVTVMIGKKPACRMNDPSLHSSCVAPIPMPAGKILPPCEPTVMTGG